MSPGEIHGLHARIVADLKRELAEAKAELAQERERANSGDWVEKAHAETLDAACKELESKLEAARAEIEQQRMRADAAESELRAEKERGNSAWDDGYAKSSSRAKVAEAKLAAIRAHLAGVDVVTLEKMERWDACTQLVHSLLAAAREALEP